eukprot:Gb_31117 [translate_table: standard]
MLIESTVEWYWTATLVGEQLEKTRTSIERTSHSIDQVVGVTTLEIVKELKKQITRREKESQQKLLEFEPVGIHRQVEEVKELLEMEGSSPSVAVILYGFGGIGKSTLANSYRRKCRGKKQKMRILITSRTNAVMQELSINSDCIKDYSVESLPDEAAIELLRTTIQVDCSHTSSLALYEDVEINAVAKACFGVPLLLDIYGRFLREDRSKNAYKYAFDSLQKGDFGSCKDADLSGQVLYVHDKMDEEAKEAFLDICVFFYGWEWDLVASVVGEMTLKKLVKRAFVKKTESGEVSVHDVLRLIGRNKAESIRVDQIRRGIEVFKFEPCIRLQSIEELSEVLEKGSEAITKVKGIWLFHNKSPFNFKCKDLEEMHDSLRVLALGNLTTLEGACRKAFRNLRFLHVGSIDTFPFESIFDFGKLAVIHNESIGGMQLPKNLHLSIMPATPSLA